MTTHTHGQHGMHTHSPNDYVLHQKPIDNEVIHNEAVPPQTVTLKMHPTKTLAEMTAEVVQFCHDKGWRPSDIAVGEELALLHSEVSEALEAWREIGLDERTREDGKPDDFASELADVFIRLLDDCAAHGIDLEYEFERKMAYNRRRPWRHGGKRM